MKRRHFLTLLAALFAWPLRKKAPAAPIAYQQTRYLMIATETGVKFVPYDVGWPAVEWELKTDLLRGADLSKLLSDRPS